MRQLERIRQNKTAGLDGNSLRVPKACVDLLCQILHQHFNLSLSQEKVPVVPVEDILPCYDTKVVNFICPHRLQTGCPNISHTESPRETGFGPSQTSGECLSHWSNTKAAHRKGQSRLHFLRKLKSCNVFLFSVCCTKCNFSAAICWCHSIRASDTKTQADEEG